jgi:ATP-dependent RNA helicase RhlE
LLQVRVDDGNALPGVFPCPTGGTPGAEGLCSVNSITDTKTVDTKTPTFADLGLAEPLLRALSAAGYSTPTPIQAQAIPALLIGRDMLGLAQTGTGKTAAFALPILDHLAAEKAHVAPKSVRALILAPTRELAVQIGDSIKTYGRNLRLRHAVILGGVSQGPQVRNLSRGVDILIATPGRLMDLLNQRHLRLDKVTHLVLDEADRMLDMGFIRDVRKIVDALPKRRQSLLFSATMPAEVAKLAHDMLHNPERVEVTPQKVTVERIAQSVHHVATPDKRPLLENLLQDPALSRVIVFTRTKHRANRVAEQLEKAGIAADAIHGNKSQNARQRALEAFRTGKARVLVATDIAARGIDVSGVTHVINYELPNEPESYVHRIGRTARAGAEGAAISFCDISERAYLRDIERLIKQRMEIVGDAPANDDVARERPAGKQGPRNQSSRKQSRGGRPGRKPGAAPAEGQKQGEQQRGQKKRSYKGLASGGAAKKQGDGRGDGGQRPFKGRRRPNRASGRPRAA